MSRTERRGLDGARLRRESLVNEAGAALFGVLKLGAKIAALGVWVGGSPSFALGALMVPSLALRALLFVRWGVPRLCLTG